MRLPGLAACFVFSASAAAAQAAGSPGVIIDQVAARRIPPGGPGCTIGVEAGARSYVRAFGAADLERGVPLTAESILEAGSVSKQFTASAVALLAIDGKLSFDDDVRRWFPELPDYGATITVRHLLTHTSGLRDWGTIAGMEGWPRGTRAHTNEDALAIAVRQRSLNYPPGSAYSYTNTGYNLLALLVERVSGKSLAQFTKERMFEPLGMTRTSWRDDYERIVPGRALAYTGGRGSFSTDMPNENAYGNGGLLTTVGDLLTWNAAMFDARLGRAFADSVVRRMQLTSGRTIAYALGLFVNPESRRGTVLEIQHSGSTAGYRAHLIRLPGRRVSVAVLCNAGGAINATAIANEIVDVMLGLWGTGVTNDRGMTCPAAAPLSVYAGTWVHSVRRMAVRVTVAGGSLRRGNVEMRPVGGAKFYDPATNAEIEFAFGNDGQPVRMTVTTADGDVTTYDRAEAAVTDANTLNGFVGTYSTPEVRGEPFVVSVESERLVLRQGPRTRIALTPSHRDAFTAGGRIVWFTRDASGRVNAMHFGEDRAWDVTFNRN